MGELGLLPEDIRITLMRVVRAAFAFGVAKTSYLGDTNRRFEGSVSLQEVCDELDEILPEPEELATMTVADEG